MALREIIARFGFQFDQRGLKKTDQGITNVTKKMVAFGAVLAGSEVVRGFANFTKGIIEAGDKLGKTAARIGISSNELQRWETAASAAGVGSEELAVALKSLQKNATNAARGEKGLKKAFDDLGVSLKDSGGQMKSGTQLMREVGLALNGLETDTERVAISQKLMEESGYKLLTMFKGQEKGLDELLALHDEFGGGLGTDAVKNAEAASDALLKLKVAQMSLKSAFAVHVLPVISQFVVGLARGAVAVKRFFGETEALKSLVVALGVALRGMLLANIAKFGKSLLSLARAAAIPLLKFILLFLVIDDLIALFQGRGSVIGTFIDKIFGKGTAAAVVNGVKDIGKAVKDVIATGDFKKFDEDLEAIFGPPGEAMVNAVVKFFTVEIPEALSFLAKDLERWKNQAVQKIASWGMETVASLKASAILLAETAKQIGKDIIDGIVDGIKAGAKAVKDELTGIAKGALKAAKDLIGAKSPSKVFAVEVGAPIVQGIAMGAKGAAGAAGRITGDAIAAASGLGPKTLSAPARGGGGGGIAGGVVFKSDINLTVSGGSPGDPQIAKLRQGVRSELRDNRRATLDALHQLVEAPA